MNAMQYMEIIEQLKELADKIEENDKRINELELKIQGLNKYLNDNYKNIN